MQRQSRFGRWIVASLWLALAPSLSLGQSSPALPLHFLNAGSKIVPKQRVVIPANADQLVLTSAQNPGSLCRLRVKERKPFHRVLEPEHPLIVAETSRAGFSSAHRASITTYVHFSSHSIDDLVCTADRGSHEMNLGEFERLLSSYFTVEISEQAYAITD